MTQTCLHLDYMILLEKLDGFDFRILSIIGIYVTLLLKPLKAKFIENIQKAIVDENNKSHDQLIHTADRIVKSRKTPKREKNYIQRVLSNYNTPYHPSVWVRSISGISSICLGYCVFLLIAVFTYSISNLDVIINSVLLSSLFTLIATFIFVCLVDGAGFNSNYVYSFNFLSFLYGLIPILIGLFITALKFHLFTISIETAKVLIYASFWIPFIPIIIAFISTICVYWKKYKSCSLLKKSLKDFKSRKLKQDLDQTNQ